MPFPKAQAISAIPISHEFLKDYFYLVAMSWNHEDEEVRASISLLLPERSKTTPTK